MQQPQQTASESPEYQERVRQYLESELAAEHKPGRGTLDAFTQLPNFALNRGPVDEEMIRSSIELINARRDCADFALCGLLRILYLYRESPLLSTKLLAEIEDAVLKFCYWYDQPGVLGMCFHTENHQILFHTCELLAGQLFPDSIFQNDGRDGRFHISHGAALAKQWMDQRARFGFAEWLSNGYFDEDLLALIALYDFADAPEIRRHAGLLIDMLLLEIALHSFQGVLSTTTGRTYIPFIHHGRSAPTSQIAWLVFGLGEFSGRTYFTLSSLCTSSYCVPPVIYDIAHDQHERITLMERHGLNVTDAQKFGIRHDSVSDNMFFWACQTARHPDVRATTLRVAEIANDPWQVNFVNTVDEPLERCKNLIEEAGGVFDGDVVNTALSEANLVTFRTPYYQLSCAQDFRRGKPGYQQHIWQASLSPEAIVYTSHPGTDNENADHLSRPNYWAGNRWLPRAAQYENVLVCIHHVPQDDPRPYSHAYFPRHHYDQVHSEGNWVFGRKGSGYVALFASVPPTWLEEGPYAGMDLRAASPDAIWICEMGSEDQNGSFERFMASILAAPVQANRFDMEYQSPAVGAVRFGWTGPFSVNGREVPLTGYPRFANPYCQAELGEKRYVIKHGDDQLVLDFNDSVV